MIDEAGKVPTLTKLVINYLTQISKQDLIINTDLSIHNYMMLLYKESQNMSHGCGYLYFANMGAWMDYKNIINILDTFIGQTLDKIIKCFLVYSIKDTQNLEFAIILKEKLEEMGALVIEKRKIINE